MSGENENLFVANYIKRHEATLLEHIRKQLDAETRNVLLEMAVTELTKQTEEQKNTIQSLQDTVEQALDSVRITSIENENITNRAAKLEDELNGWRTKYNDLEQDLKDKHNVIEQDFKRKYSEQNVTLVAAQQEVQHLREVVSSLEQNLSTTKNNYNITLKNLNDCELKLLNKPPKKKVGVESPAKPDSEWIDGDEISS